jgi:aminopeptidase N
MAHPVRPASYAEINNFYTATVYQKGAEVVRMIHTLLGRDGFRKGMDLYFQRHDGQAVTCDDFVAAMQDATGVDLGQFRRWYERAGTPHLKASGQYDPVSRRYTLTVEQTLAPTVYEQRLTEAGIAVDLGPLHIPLALGLVLPSGQDAVLRLSGETARAHASTRVLSLTLPVQQFVFEDVAEAPIPSLLRDFSAPVVLDFAHSIDDLAHLMAFDSDPFNRWEAGQRLTSQILLARISSDTADPWIPPTYVTAMRRVILDALAGGDPALAAEAMVLPSEQELAEAVAAQGNLIDPDRIHCARVELRQHLAQQLRDDLEHVWLSLAPTAPYAPDGKQIGRRALRNICLSYLAESEVAYLQAKVIPRLMAQFRNADNMTDVMAALGCLVNLDAPEREIALDEFYAKWQHETLVVDKWLQVQATSRLPDTGARVRALLKHPGFNIKVPNKVYALVRAFCASNPVHFHAADGSGYRLAAAVIGELHAMNPQVAARLARSYDRWRQFDAARQNHARSALEQIQEMDGLPRDVAEVIAKALA